MIRVVVTITLLCLFTGYSFLVYTRGTEGIQLAGEAGRLANEGKLLYQQYNCSSCHQIYGLGGYLGPDLTTAYSDRHRGEAYMKAMLESGGNRMPNFHLSGKQIQAIITYLKYVDATAAPLRNEKGRSQ